MILSVRITDQATIALVRREMAEGKHPDPVAAARRLILLGASTSPLFRERIDREQAKIKARQIAEREKAAAEKAAAEKAATEAAAAADPNSVDPSNASNP